MADFVRHRKIDGTFPELMASDAGARLVWNRILAARVELAHEMDAAEAAGAVFDKLDETITITWRARPMPAPATKEGS